MPWVKLDDGYPWHPKVAAAGPVGLALHVAGLCYANRYLTDGLVPRVVLSWLLAAPWEEIDDAAKMLESVGLWDPDPAGWRIHDYHDYQPTREEAIAGRRQRIEAGRKGGLARAEAEALARAQATAIADAQADPQASRLSAAIAPDPTRKDKNTPNPASGALDDLRYSRSEVRDVVCPSCGVLAGDPCIGSRGQPRESNHAERILHRAQAGAAGEDARLRANAFDSAVALGRNRAPYLDEAQICAELEQRYAGDVELIEAGLEAWRRARQESSNA